ncbi:MAG: hypothetical protein WD794_10240 [Mycobacteriales bacterium]
MAQQSRPPGGAAGVSAEDLLAAVRVHADRVHDAVRRLGCDPATAVEVVETSALDLVEAVARRPETVADAVGWWFAQALSLGRRVAGRGRDLPLGGGVLAVDEDQEILAAALDQLPDRERVALLLRDSYDLPAVSVGAALNLDADEAMELVGRARLAFLPLVDDEPAPAVPAHQHDVAALARIGQGMQTAARDATTRRHALSCDECRSVTDAQQRAHLLLTGLTVAALPEGERAAVLNRVESSTYAALPTHAALLAAEQDEQWEDEEEEPRLFSPLIALLSVVLAVLLGVGAGLLLTRGGGEGVNSSAGRAPQDVALISEPPAEPEVLLTPPPLQLPSPRTSVFVLEPTPSPSPTPEAVRSTAPAQEPLSLVVDPASGPNGATLTVSGTGWRPGTQVQLDYLDPTGTPTGSRSVVVPDARGRFTGQLSAQDPANLPGRHTVRASNGTQVAEAPYDAQA